jgi:DNA polymerase-1
LGLEDVELTLIETGEDVENFFSWLGERRPVMGLDIETSGLSLTRDHVRLVQFGDAKSGWAMAYEDWRGVVKDVLRRYEGAYVLHHAKFDAGFLIKDGLEFPWSRAHDTMFMCFLRDSEGPKGLKRAATRYIDEAAAVGEKQLKKAMARGRWQYDNVPVTLPEYWAYGALDAVITARLAEHLWPQIQPYRQAYDIEMACERVLCDMELRGVRIDVDYCREQRSVLAADYDFALEKLGDVNPHSPSQIIVALINDGAVLTKKTEKGQLAVDDEVLSGLREQHPIAGFVLEARSIQKILSSYIDNFLDFHDEGILRPHINQVAARTGRMSVTDPALQTLPRKSLVRDAFVPGEENKLVLIDYDNQELRVAAHFSGDEKMLAAFDDGRDLHSETARELYGPNFTAEQRGWSKNCMFGKAYGAGPAKFATASHMPEHEAVRVFRMLDQLYPGLAKAMGKSTMLVRERADGGEYGWVKILDGRHLLVPADKPYVGFNRLIQGSCAVVLKQALVDLDLAGYGELLRLPIHDEVLFDIPEKLINDGIVGDIIGVMTRSDFRTPLTLSSEVVNRWGDKYRKDA